MIAAKPTNIIPSEGKTFFEWIMGNVDTSNGMTDESFSKLEATLRKFLNTDTLNEITLFFGFSKNLGHRANTVHIMDRLISYIESSRLTVFRVVYDVYDPSVLYPLTREAAQREFANALSKLVPFLPTSHIIEAKSYRLLSHPNVCLEFYCCNSKDKTVVPKLPTRPCALAFTGGFDNTANISKLLNAQWLISLSPYRYTKQWIFNTIYAPKDRSDAGFCLGPIYDETGTKVIENFVGFYKESFTERAFYYPNPTQDSILWNAYKSIEPIKYNLVTEMLRLRSPVHLELMPIYFSPGRIYCEPYETLFNLVAGIYMHKEMQKILGKRRRCTVMVVFGGFEDRDYRRFKDLVTKGEKEYPYLSAFSKAAFGHLIEDHFEIIDATATVSDLNAAIAKVTNEGIVLVRLGMMPNYISNYFFTEGADLPAVFEGEGSASLLLNAGKPFLHLMSSDVRLQVEASGRMHYLTTNRFYPSVPFDAADPAADKCHNISLELVNDFEKWERCLSGKEDYDDDDDLEETFPGEQVGRFLIESYDLSTKEGLYFKKLGFFYHQEKNDKLMMGLACLMEMMK